jgi:two-component system chemotaxis response regulator CheB
MADRKKKLRVLICDDSAFLRVTLRKIIESDHALRVVDIARNGAEAVEKAVRLRPDVITMDIHMPVVDGLTALKDIARLKVAPVIMLTAANTRDAGIAVDAMEAGAFDFIAKPDASESLESRAPTILQKLKQAAASDIYRKLQDPPDAEPGPVAEVEPPAIEDIPVAAPVRPARSPGYRAVALGLSTGGPKSIFHVLPHLPADLPAPVFVIQHMPPAFLTTFAERLDQKTQLPCVETQAGMPVEPGKIYVARGGFHLKLMQKSNGEIVIRQSKEPRHLFMPSVDVAMNSICDVFGSDTVAVLMTGMGRDGADAMVRVARSGGMTIAESEETAIVFGMPKEAIRRGGARRVMPKQEIAGGIVWAVRKT